jgi:histone H2A
MAGGKGKSGGGKSGAKGAPPTEAPASKKQQSHSARAGLQVCVRRERRALRGGVVPVPGSCGGLPLLPT